MKKMIPVGFFTGVIALLLLGATTVSHKDMKGVDMHTPFRWVFNDSTSRKAAVCYKTDTMKIALQLSDYTIWVLKDTLPSWRQMDGNKVDSLVIRAVGGSVKFDSLSFGSSTSHLSSYTDTSFPCSLYENTTLKTPHGVGSARIVKIGNQVTISFPSLYGSFSSGTILLKGFPAKYCPQSTDSYMYFPFVLVSGGSDIVGTIYWNLPLNEWVILESISGDGGFDRTSINYLLNP
jgi:hypothetical protein